MLKQNDLSEPNEVNNNSSTKLDKPPLKPKPKITRSPATDIKETTFSNDVFTEIKPRIDSYSSKLSIGKDPPSGILASDMGCVFGVNRQLNDDDENNESSDSKDDSLLDDSTAPTLPKPGLVKDRIRIFGACEAKANSYNSKLHVPNTLQKPAELTLRRKSDSNNDPMKRLSTNSSSSGNSSFSYRIYEDMEEEFPNDSEREDAEKRSKKEYRCHSLRMELLETEKTMFRRYDYLIKKLPEKWENYREKHNISPIEGFEERLLKFLETLYLCSETLIADLEKRMQSEWKKKPYILDVILNIGPYLKCYTPYLAKWEAEVSPLAHLKKENQHFCKFADMRDLEVRELNLGFNLEEVFKAPTFRLMKYPILLENYKSYLEPHMEDYNYIDTAIRITKAAAEHSNITLGARNDYKECLKWQRQIIDYDKIPEKLRKFVHFGQVKKFCRSVKQDRYLLLFSDVLLVLREIITGQYKCPQYFDWTVDGVGKIDFELKDNPLAFTIASKKLAMKFEALDEQSFNCWREKLQKVLDTDDRHQGDEGETEEPKPWINDQEVTKCQACSKKFKIINRRHHCRRCGKIFCGACSDGSAPLDDDKYKGKIKRVCYVCYAILLGEHEKKYRELRSLANSPGINMGEIQRIYQSIINKFKRPSIIIDYETALQKLKDQEKAAISRECDKSSFLFYRRGVNNTKWEKKWVVLIDEVLYLYGAPQDSKAEETIPLLSWKLNFTPRSEESQYSGATRPRKGSVAKDLASHFNSNFSTMDSRTEFSLFHKNVPAINLKADQSIAEEWITKIQDVLSKYDPA
ncbi:DgyrCDS13161 [Dimorphilus gyrociliatus]|uniref:DgyrCDS13161 n=1 Tax=Dimorphilus gyrociliatus TaxID=2664684 RepID=A0A7I8W9U7_9ANNE|nr:DgyrCDS13161 [Dimorphilus gyrociliatus]